MISIKNLSKTIGNKLILDNINLIINTGDVLGLIGPNGAGKTTLMKCICQLSKINNGQILIDGIPIHNNKTNIQKVGYLIENTCSYDWLTGYDNLIILSKMYKTIPKSRIDEIVELLKLNNVIKKKVSTYSLGTKRKLGIAMALLNSPSIVVLDEPTNGLDIDAVNDFQQIIKEMVNNYGMTVLISSHIMDTLNTMCNRVAVMKDGKIIKNVERKNISNMSYFNIYQNIVKGESDAISIV